MRAWPWLLLVACRSASTEPATTSTEQPLAVTAPEGDCSGVTLALQWRGAEPVGTFVNRGPGAVTLALPGRALPGRWEPAAAPPEDCDEKAEAPERVTLRPGESRTFEPWGKPAAAVARYRYEASGCLLEATLPPR